MLSVKIVEKGDISGILKFVNDNKTNLNSCILQTLKEQNGQWAGRGDAVAATFEFLEREGVASL